MNLPDIELTAERVHKNWMNLKLASGIKSRVSEKGEELMVPYNELTDESKELDRASVRAVYDAIKELNQ